MWELAAEAAVYSYNITPHKSINYEIPLLKKISKSASTHLDKIKRFGCISYAKCPKTETKFSNVAIKAVLVGHTSTGYILWHPSTRKFLESRHVRFIERWVYKNVYKKEQNESSNDLVTFSKGDEIDQPNSNISTENFNVEKSKINKPENKKRGRPKKTEVVKDKQNLEYNKEKLPNDHINNDDGPITRSKAKKIEDISFARYTRVSEVREIKEDELGHILLASIQKDPTNFEEAMNSEDKDLWKQAFKEELDSMKENNVQVLIDRPKEKPDGKRVNIIDSKWVFKKKVENEGKIKYKDRLVIRGFKDKNVYDLKETYAPVSRLSLIRAVISTINKNDLEMCQLDVKTAFLNGELDDDVFMEIPQGLEVIKNKKLITVCKLK